MNWNHKKTGSIFFFLGEKEGGVAKKADVGMESLVRYL